MNKLKHIVLAIVVYAQSRGVWPDNLEMLRDFGITEGLLINPLRPDQVPGYVYRKPRHPVEELTNAGNVILVHGAYDEWPGQITVGFADFQSALIANEAEFKKLLAVDR
jgi:hypothetical protein